MDTLASNEDETDAPLKQIIGLLGEEVKDLGHTLDDLQSLLSVAIWKVAHDPECHRNVQALDELSQRLHALAIFVSTLEKGVPPAWRMDLEAALRRVTLSDLAWRLKGQPRRKEPVPEAGVAEMF